MATQTRNPRKTALLDQAVTDWRQARGGADQRLSAGARDAILQAALEPTMTSDRPFPALFLPLRKLLTAGALPVVVLTVALGWFARPAIDVPAVASHAAPPVHVTKSGEEVIFLIANGNRPHTIYKSEAANRFEAPPAFWTEDGSFRDRLDAGPDLVFYRID